MNKLLKTMLFSLMVLLPLGAKAEIPPLGAKTEICNEQSKWWPYCLQDPASGPDVGTKEWISCKKRGGCK